MESAPVRKQPPSLSRGRYISADVRLVRNMDEYKINHDIITSDVCNLVEYLLLTQDTNTKAMKILSEINSIIDVPSLGSKLE